MKKGFLLVLICSLGLFLVTGCSVKQMNPFAKASKPPAGTENQSPEKANGEEEKVQDAVNIDRIVVEMVNETRAGFVNKAIALGEEVYSQGEKSDKFLDTLAIAYGYKLQLEGLEAQETDNYLRTLRSLVSLDSANLFRKSWLAMALIETGNVAEGNKLAAEIYNSAETKPKEILDTYGWGLYKAGKAAEALPVYQTLDSMGTDNLSQTYHTAMVIETVDKAKALALYKKIVAWANNALTWEENKDNLAATAHINKIKKDSQDAINRIQLKGRSAH